MKPSARRLAETLLLAATSLSLLGHGGDVPTCFAHAPASRTFNLVGTCGPPGVITVTTDPCGVTLTGDDVGLPTSGNLGATLDVGFQLYGEINSDWKLECGAAPAFPTDAGAPAPGEYGILCRRRPGPTNPYPLADDVDWCRADLLPVTPTCDIHACAPATCSTDEQRHSPRRVAVRRASRTGPTIRSRRPCRPRASAKPVRRAALLGKN
jgi:hypothetical protein